MNLKAMFLGLACLGLIQTAGAQQVLEGTLKKVAEQKAVYLGFRESAQPFTYVDAGGQVRGYSWDLCLKVVDAIKQRLEMPGLEILPVPVTVTTRTLMLSTGVIDLDCTSAPNTLIAQKHVAFGVTSYVASLKVLVRKDSGIKTLADLGGKSVISPAGVDAERYLKSAPSLRGVDMSYILGRGGAETFRTFESGGAAAMVLDEASMAVFLAQSPNKDQYMMLDQSLAFEPQAMAMRLGDAGLKQLVDEVLRGLMTSGEINQIYDNWFVSPIPPTGLNLDLPMDSLLKGMIQNPSDRGV